jgi:hypothetical protein
MESRDSRSALRKQLSRSASTIQPECARSIGEAPDEWELMMQIGDRLKTIIVEPLELPIEEPQDQPEPIAPEPQPEPEKEPATK